MQLVVLTRRGLGNVTVKNVVRGRTAAAGLLIGLGSAGLHVTGEGCVGLMEVLAAGVATRTWIGLDLSG